MCDCKRTYTYDDCRRYYGETGLEIEITSHTVCLDCDKEVEPSTNETLAWDHEPTIFEIESDDSIPY